MAFMDIYRGDSKCITVSAFFVSLAFLVACSGGGSDDGKAVQTGAIALNLKIQNENVTRLQRLAEVTDLDCEANQIETVQAYVYNHLNEQIAEGGPWECETHEGIIDNVEVGHTLTVEVMAKDYEGIAVFKGETTNVIVTPGKTTETDPIILSPVINRRPVLTPIGPQSVLEENNLEFAISATDPDADNQLAFSADNLPPGATFLPNERLFRWNPGAQDGGIYTVHFIVTDDGDPPLSDSESVTISVGDVNRAPRFAPIEPQIVEAGNLLEFTVSATDPDGDQLTYEAISLPEPDLFDKATQIFSWIPDWDDLGEYTAEFRAVDDGEPNLSHKIEVMITVGGNRSPQFDPIGDQQVDAGELLEFQVTATDPDQDFLSFSASGTPQGASFDPQTQQFRWQTEMEDFGEHTVIFTVTDDGDPAMSDTVELTISVGGNRPPEFVAPVEPVTGLEGTTIRFEVIAEDPDEDNLSYEAEELPGGADFDGRTFTWPTDLQDSGTYSIIFRVTDDGEPQLSDELEVIITVFDYEAPPDVINHAPVLDPIGEKIVDLRQCDGPCAFEFVISGSDIDGDELTFTAELPPILNEKASFDPANRTFTWPNITSVDIGQYTVKFLVTDNGNPNLSDYENVPIRVEGNTPPEFVMVGNETVLDGEPIFVSGPDILPLTLEVLADDPDGDVLTYTATGLPLGAVFNEQSRTLSWEFLEIPVLFSVSDEGYPPLTDNLKVLISIFYENRAPVLNYIGSKGYNLATSSGSLSFQVNGYDPNNPDDPAGILTFSAGGLPEGAVFQNQEFIWSDISVEDMGPHTVSFTVSDGGNPSLSDSETVTITVYENNPPFFTQVNEEIITAEQDSVDISADGQGPISITLLASDKDKDVLSFWVAGTDLPTGWSFDADSRTFEWNEPELGDYYIDFFVRDNGNLPLEDRVTVYLQVNSPPVFTKVNNNDFFHQDIIIDWNAGEPLSFAVEAFDLDNDELFFNVYDFPNDLFVLPENAVITNNNQTIDGYSAEFVWKSPEKGTYFFELEVTDGKYSDLANVILVIQDGIQNDAPLVTYPRWGRYIYLSNYGGLTSLDFNVKVFDLNNDNITYELIKSPDPNARELPADIIFNSSTGQFLWPEITSEDAGEYQMRFIIEDDGKPRESNFSDVTIRIIDDYINQPPQFTEVENVDVSEENIESISLDFPELPLSFSVDATDPNRDPLVFSASGYPEGASFQNQIFEWNYYETSILFTVTDDGDPPLSDSVEVNIRIGQ